MLLLSLLLIAADARGQAYYSEGTPSKAVLSSNCLLGLNLCTGKIQLSVTAPTQGANITATVTLPKAGSARLRYQLNGTALAGYRAGVLVSAARAALSINTLGNVTLRTFLSTNPNQAQETHIVLGNVVQAQLLAGQGDPTQLEFISLKDFDQVEIEFGSVLNLGTDLQTYYAYGIGPNQAVPVMGFTSIFPADTSGPITTAGCPDKITHPDYAADSDSASYATFSSLLSVNCNPQLRVGLTGTAPGTYRAGFVIGQANTLLTSSLLSSLKLTTYKENLSALRNCCCA